MDETACDAVTSSQSDVLSCWSNVQNRLDRLAGEGGAQGGLTGCQGGPSAQDGPSPRSLDPNFRTLDRLVVCMWSCSLTNIQNLNQLLLCTNESCIVRII